MKTKILLFVAIFLGLYNSSFSTTCCDYITVTYVVTSDCCVEFTIYNPSCNVAWASIQQKIGSNYVQEAYYDLAPMGTTITYKMCSVPGQRYVDWKIQFDGPSPCSQSGYVGLSLCCNCPPDVNSWLTLEVDDDSPDCGPNECKVTPHLNIPSNITCYSHYYVEVGNSNSGNVPMSTPIENQSVCIAKGSTVEFYVCFLKSASEDPFELNCYADVVSETCTEKLPTPCVPDCEEDQFTPAHTNTLHLELLCCPGCFVDVTYTYRWACNTWQDIQILALNYPSSGPCASYDNKTLYIEALKGIIAINQMGFEPVEAPGCSDVWRVANASCWGKKFLYYRVENGTYEAVYEYLPCEGSACCLQKMRVCRIAPQTVTVTQLGPVYTSSNSCTMTIMGTDGLSYPCDTACNWAGEINGTFGYPLFAKNGAINIPQYKEIKRDNSYQFAISTAINQQFIGFSIESKENKKASVEIYDLNGALLKTFDFNISIGNNSFNFDISKLISGTYFYTLNVEGVKLAGDKFNIVR